MQREIINRPALLASVKKLNKGDYRKSLYLLAVIDHLEGSATQAELEINTSINRGVIKGHIKHLEQLSVEILTTGHGTGTGTGTGTGDITYRLISWGDLINPEAVRMMLVDLVNGDVNE